MRQYYIAYSSKYESSILIYNLQISFHSYKQYKEYINNPNIPEMDENLLVQPPLYFAENNMHIWCAQFHPSQNILATTLINGHIEILQYDSEDVKRITKITDCHKSSARYCQFNSSGTILATCAEDKRLGFIDASGKTAHIIRKAHNNPINRVKFANDQILVSGDDEGVIKVWDLRNSQCVFEVEEQTQAITGLHFDEEHSNVISSCLDGTLAIYDLKQGTDSPNKLYALSDSTDEQLHGLQMMKNEKYIICPSSQNSILIYKRENINSYIDRIMGQAGSVEAILKIDQNTFLSGSEDGFVRALGIYPHKKIQVIGQHEQQENFPVQSLALSHCRNIVASTSHDNSIKFYDVSQFVKIRSQMKFQEEEVKQIIAPYQIVKEQSSIFQEDEASYQQDDSDDSDDEQVSKQKGKKKKKKKVNLKARKTQMKKESQKKFFKDL